MRRVRLDLTERQEYSISSVTSDLLQSLNAPLLIRGYFSAKTHPLLTPLVPRIRDMLSEYQAVGGDRIITEFVDPQQDPAAEKEANEDYGIKSVPFQFADRHEAAVVNSYFHLLVKYGDKYETLSFQDLIELNVTGMNNIEVKLRNLEYDLTRSIKKVAYGFRPLEELFASVPGKVMLTAYISQQNLPKNFQQVAEQVEQLAKELKQRGKEHFELQVIDPIATGDRALQQRLQQQYGIRPMITSLFAGNAFYLHFVVAGG